MRDDFSTGTKELLAERVGYRCSNPDCRQPTSGPQEDPTKAINVGVAAHITAASSNGPRFDASLTPEQRCSSENGIWVCQTCAKLVDNDTSKGRVMFCTGDVRRERLEPAHIVLANLTGALLVSTASMLLSAVRAGGHLVASGLAVSEEAAVVSALSAGAHVVARSVEGEWVALTCRAQPRATDG